MSNSRTGAGTSRTRPERGDLFGARFELFADVLSLGLAAAVAALPLVTFPAALSTACALLRRRRLLDEPCTAGRYAAALRRRLARPGDWAAGAVMLAFTAVVAADAGLATAGLPGAVPFATGLAAVAVAAAVAGLRSCALRGDTDLEQAESGRAHSERTDSERTDSERTDSERTDSERTDSERTDSGRTELGCAELGCADSGRTGAARSGAVPGPPEPPGWAPAVRAGARRTFADLPGSGLVVLALCTAGVAAWSLPPVLFLLPGPLALALTAVELRGERDG
ncbi:hypothetical protein HCC61_01025 [Streptomyces sp. HNM0575]|uniref:hypothetical protein n=1 Tax=Streptomyces sp. HNM0575 TaxID=2716338 RepID=UPI00145E3CC6|nr:hypothetical protein [Streptomyces sp. HNM0575]NLU71295.1 hypothetical protein [Streptomyces sp. HNM0575]